MVAPADTALFIYYMEENASFLPLVAPIFEDVAAGCLKLRSYR